MPFIPEGRSSTNSSKNNSQTTQHISLADLKQQVGLTSIGNNGSGVTLSPATRSQTNSNNNSSSSAAASSSAINIQKIIQREAAAAAANLNNNYRSSTEAAAALAAAAQRKRRLQMAKMMSNGGGGSGMATISFANQGAGGQGHHPHRSHGSSSGLNNSSHLSGSDRDRGDRSSSGAASSANNNPNDPMFVSNRRARSNNFTLKETFDLLKVWASPEMQWQMKHNFRNFRVWEAISYQMGQMGHDRTAIQCKNRIQNLTSIFYRIKKSKQDYRTFNFPYYKLIGDVLDGKKAGVSLGASFSGTAHVFGIPHPNDPFLNAAALAATSGGNNRSSDEMSPNSSQNNAGFAAHLALVEEYQHLINGQPDLYGSSGGSNGIGTNGTGGGGGSGRPSSNNSNSGHNVLSPEISLSEGDSPIRVDGTKGSSLVNSHVKNASARNGTSSSVNSSNRTHNFDDNGELLDDENEQGFDMEDGLGLGDEDDFQDEISNTLPSSRSKRSFSATFGPYSTSNSKGFPVKRPRGVSAASSSGGGLGLSSSAHHHRQQQQQQQLPNVNGGSEDPIVQYLSDMVDIERQWLDMERERADNERSMMMYMMQILQALVCPSEQEEDAEAEGEEGAADEEADDGDLLDPQTTLDETYDDADPDESANVNVNNHVDDETAQLRQMLRDNAAAEQGGDEDGEEEDDEEDEEIEEEVPEVEPRRAQKPISLQVVKNEINKGKIPSSTASVTITKSELVN